MYNKQKEYVSLSSHSSATMQSRKIKITHEKENLLWLMKIWILRTFYEDEYDMIKHDYKIQDYILILKQGLALQQTCSVVIAADIFWREIIYCHVWSLFVPAFLRPRDVML